MVFDQAKNRRRVLACLLTPALLLATWLPAAPLYADDAPLPDATDGYLVKVKEDLTDEEEQSLVDAIEAEEAIDAEDLVDGLFVVDSADTLDTIDQDLVEYVEPNYPVLLAAAPNDPYYADQYNLERMHVPALWESGVEAEGGPVVALIDSGLYVGHEDIDSARVVPGRAFTAAGPSDDTGDVIGHGTQVTGVLMATSDNAVGIAGISSSLRVMPLKITDAQGQASTKQLIDAIVYATEQRRAYDQGQGGANIQVLNISLEVDTAGESAPQLLKEACQDAMNAGIILVCAGGNSGDGSPTYPAQYGLGVGASGYDPASGDVHAGYSNVLSADNGAGYENKIWVSAPANDLTVPSVGGASSYAVVSGTSYAAPEVAALAGVVKSIDPSMTQQGFQSLLQSTADPVQGERGQIGAQDVEYGHGIVNYAKALEAMGVLSAAPAEESETGAKVSEEPAVNDEAAQPQAGEETAEEAGVLPNGDVDPESPQFDAQVNKTSDAELPLADSLNDVQLLGTSKYLGIDVSEHNRTINWSQVKASGVKFVFVRVGYAGWSRGGRYEDATYKANIVGAYKAGLKVGVYFYSQARNEKEAQAEAQFLIDRVKPYKKYIRLPFVMDMESPLTYTYAGTSYPTYWAAGKVSKKQAAANYVAFSKKVKAAGYHSMLYTYTYWIQDHLGTNMNTVRATGDPFWLAEYPGSSTALPPKFADLFGKVYGYEFWQYSSTKKIKGISGYVDCNYWYTSNINKYNKAPTAAVAAKISISGNNALATLTRGKNYTIKGTLSSNKKINRVEIGVVSKKTRDWVYSIKYDNKSVGATSFNINKANSKVNFSKLAAGDYYYRIWVHTADGTVKKVLDKPFTVKNITLSGYSQPGTLAKGKSCQLKGTISSYAKIKRVEIGVVNRKTGQWTAQKYDNKKVNANTFNIAKADSKIKFGKLPKGTYYYRIWVHPQGGKATRILNVPFTVK